MVNFEDEYERIVFYNNLDDEQRKHFYLEDGDKYICRFCGKEETETKFDKSAHAISEMVGNNWLFSYRECKNCNAAFGSTCEDSFGKYVLPLKIVSQVYGKKKSMGYSVKDAQIKMNKDKAVLPEFNDSVNAIIKAVSGNSILIPEKDGFLLQLNRKRYIPQMVYFSLLKMALTILPPEEYKNYVYNYVTLNLLSDKAKESDDILKNLNVCGFEEFIPGPDRFDGTSVELYRIKDIDSKRPYMYFCLNFGNYSLQIPLPTDQQQDGTNISIMSCKHHKESVTRTLRFDKFEEIFQCHFDATIIELTSEEMERLAKILNLKTKSN